MTAITQSSWPLDKDNPLTKFYFASNWKSSVINSYYNLDHKRATISDKLQQYATFISWSCARISEKSSFEWIPKVTCKEDDNYYEHVCHSLTIVVTIDGSVTVHIIATGSLTIGKYLLLNKVLFKNSSSGLIYKLNLSDIGWQRIIYMNVLRIPILDVWTSNNQHIEANKLSIHELFGEYYFWHPLNQTEALKIFICVTLTHIIPSTFGLIANKSGW